MRSWTLALQIWVHNFLKNNKIDIHSRIQYSALMQSLAGPDLFHLFRRSLVLVCSIYTLLLAYRAVNRWLDAGDPSRPAQARIKRYLTTQLLRTRVGTFASDLLQIAFLLVVLCYLITLHS